MIDQTQTPQGGSAEEIELLLPWYVNGTLNADEVAKVEAFLVEHPEMNVQLATLRDDSQHTIEAYEAIGAPGGAALGRLMDQIKREPAPVNAGSLGRSVVASIERFLTSLTPGRLGWSAMAAAVVIMLQAGVVGTMLLKPPSTETTYQTASGGKSLEGTYVLVKFQPDVSAGEIGEFFAELGGEIVAGPKPGGLFRVRVSDKLLGEAKQQALIAKLSGETKLFSVVLPSK